MNLKKTARLRIKRNHRNYRGLLIILFLSFVFSAAGQCVQGSAAETDRQQKFDLYGEWKAVVCHAEEQTVKALRSHASVEAMGMMKSYADAESETGYGACKAGTLDERTKELGHIRLIEGRYPQRAGEITAERAALSLLGFSFDLGQTISLNLCYTDTSGELINEKRSWVLIGTTNTFSTGWDWGSSDEPVTLFLSEQDPLVHAAASSDTLLLSGSQINDKSIMEFEPLLGEGSELVYNEKAYPRRVVSLPYLLEENFITLVIWSGCTAFIFYSISLFLSSQRYQLQLMRVLGAGKGQIRQLLRYDLMSILLFTALPGSVAGIGVSWLIVVLQNQLFDLNLRFLIQPADLLLSAVIVCIAFYFAMFWAFLTLGRQDSEKPETQKNIVIRRMNPIRVKHFEGDFLRREYLADKGTIHLRILITGILSMTLFLMMMNISVDYRQYHSLFGQGSPAYLWFFQIDDGFSERDAERLKQVEGIAMSDALLQSKNSDIRWAGCEESRYRTQLYKDAYGAVNRGFTAAVDTGSPLFQYFLDEVDKGSAAKEDIDEGKCIILLSDLVAGANGGYRAYTHSDFHQIDHSLLKEDTLSPGDTLMIESEIGSFTTEVAGIIYDSKNKPEEYSEPRIGNLQPMSVILSKNYLENYFQKEYDYNEILAYGEFQNISDVTDKEISRIKGNGKAEFFNNRQRQEQYREMIRAKISSKGLFLFFTLAFGGMVLFFNNLQYLIESRGREELCRSLGMNTKKIRGLYNKQALRICLIGAAWGMIPMFLLYFCYPLIQIYQQEQWSFDLLTSLYIWHQETGKLLFSILPAAVISIVLYCFVLMRYRAGTKIQDVT